MINMIVWLLLCLNMVPSMLIAANDDTELFMKNINNERDIFVALGFKIKESSGGFFSRNVPEERYFIANKYISIASGSSEALHEFQEFLKAGPRHAQVDSVQASEVLDERDEPKTFEIKH